MLSWFTRAGGLLRALGLGSLALATVLGRPTVDRPLPDPDRAAAVGGVPDQGKWSLRAGGWFISIDGADIEIPTVAQLTRPVVRALAPQLSPYDVLIAYHADAEGLDWRLVAALIYEESRFDPNAVSDAGAFGLMQVMPVAAAAVGAREFHAPSDNIRTGARYLKQLSETFSDSQGRDHLALVLAAYNMGPGHLRDAQTLARHFGYDPTRWSDSMERMLPLLEQSHLAEQLPNGYANGLLTAAYVNRILDRYDGYRRRFGSKPFDLGDDEDSQPDDPSDEVTQAASANG